MLAGPKAPIGRLWFLRAVVVVAAVVLTARLYQLQIVEGASFRLLADRNRLREVEVPASRGVMYDRNGQLMISNRPSFTVAVIPADLPKTDRGEPDLEAQDRVLDRLEELLHRSAGGTTEPVTEPDEVSAAATVVSPPAGATVTPVPTTAGAGQPESEFLQRQPWVMPRAEIDTSVDVAYGGGAYRPITVARYIDESTAFLIAQDAAHLPGVQLVLIPIRDYLTASLTAHTLGYMGSVPAAELALYEAKGYDQTDNVGLTGLEYAFEEVMAGVDGKQVIEVDVNGRMVRSIGQAEPAKPGHNLVLSIDLELQQAATTALQDAFDASKDFTRASQGAVVAMDPRSGAIRALVSLPTFDNNLFAKGITTEAWDRLTSNPDLPLVNKAIAGLYPPGSTFKLVTASGGLAEGAITANTRLGDGVDGRNDGILYLPNRYSPNDLSKAQPFYCWIHNYGRGHGSITVRDALAQSCDIFFYQLGGGYKDFAGLGSETLGHYAREFGFGELAGIELPGEASGRVPDAKWKRLQWAEAWFTGDTYNMSIGQGFVVATPLQLANMTAAIANRGTLFQPQLVDHITDSEGATVRQFEPLVIRQVPVDPTMLDIVREGMYGAVSWPQGTAYRARLSSVAVAGKTGTAEYFRDDDKDGQADRDQKGNLPTHAWFTSFAPYVDPEIVVTVFVANGGEGSAVAAPIAARVLRAYFGEPEPGATPVPK